MRFVRLTMRQAMGGVAVIAILLFVHMNILKMRDNRITYLNYVEGHGNIERLLRDSESFENDMANGQIELIEQISKALRSAPENDYWKEQLENHKRALGRNRAEAIKSARRAAYYARLRAKYLRAASHPWVTVGPDPPPPNP